MPSWRCNQVDQTDVTASALFDEADGCGRAAAGGKHRVEDNQFTFLRVGGKLAVVFHRIQRHGIAVEANVTDAGRQESGS